ncbi:MAG TPA: sugar ABC transporter permease [Actinopolymorphaceae bacterium]|jgi:N-acetylglucosamine transport system permease protein
MMTKGRWPLIITFLVPPLALYAVFVLAAFAQGIQISFTDWTGLTPGFHYVGLDNYVSLVQDSDWWRALEHNLILLIVVPVITLTLALLFASLLTRGGSGGARDGLPGARFYRVLFFFPQVVPVVIVGIMFGYVYSTQSGLLQAALKTVGIDILTVIPNGPLGNPSTIIFAIALATVWSAVGFYMVLFIAGMGQIPRDLFEAAALDGAGRINIFFNVTLPLLWAHIQTATVYLGIGMLDSFALISVLAQNGTGADYGADVMATLLYRTAFTLNSQFGYASAMGTLMMLASVVLALVTFRFTRRERIEF